MNERGLVGAVLIAWLVSACVVREGPVPDAGEVDAGAEPEVDAGRCDGIDPMTDPNHCGGCGQSCPHRANALSACVAGACTSTCAAGFGDCDGVAENGCEVPLDRTAAHCGACGQACPGSDSPNVSAVCSGAVCGRRCAAGFADCNGDLVSPTSNGCEADLRSSALHCGECFRACGSGCASGACGGELAECRLLDPATTQPVGLSVASDGTHVAVAWFDFAEGGVWVALLDGRGTVVRPPRRVLVGPKASATSLAFDGTAYVLGWVSWSSGDLGLVRLAPTTLLEASPVVAVPLPAAPPFSFSLSAASGDQVAVVVPGGQLATVHVVTWRRGEAKPGAVRTATLPGTPVSWLTSLVPVRDGFAAPWVAQVPSPTSGAPPERRLGVLTIALDGTPGSTAIDAKPYLPPLGNQGVVGTRVADGAWLVGSDLFNGERQRRVRLDTNGRPEMNAGGEFTWRNEPGNATALAGDGDGFWNLGLNVTPQGTSEWRVARFDATGVASLSERVTVPVGGTARLVSRGAAGALGVVLRLPVGLGERRLSTFFLEVPGPVRTACAPTP